MNAKSAGVSLCPAGSLQAGWVEIDGPSEEVLSSQPTAWEPVPSRSLWLFAHLSSPALAFGTTSPPT